ncbi:MFS transporter [Clostridium estertheticum]|uniref:MFS transporter n=1 Tax=Clostridium estertheticum TaxID=238834 RepID=A0AA47EN35_9CLOT|nr:MFS transporter [Clostridium estertheticum]MBU3158049.1 MFS transporter [Clostridium estertheticum]WAG63272.1 MFS transporter [Clostridium estertheticum]
MKHLLTENGTQVIFKKNNVYLKYTTLILTLGLAGFISAADNWFISPSLPAIAAGFSVPVSKAGNILTSYMIPYGMMQPIYGFLSDRWSKTKILQWILCGLALGTFGCAFASSLLMLCIWRAFTGFFAAGIIAVSLALIGDTVPIFDRQIYIGKFMGIVFLGQGVSSGLGGALSKYYSWRIAFIVFAVISIITIFFLHKLPNNSPTHISHNFLKEVKQILFTEKGKIIFPLSLLTGFLLLGLYSYMGAFLHEITGLDYLQAGIVIMFYGFACLLAGSQVGKLGQKFGKKKIIIIGECLALCSAFLLIIFSCWQAIWISTISLGFGYIFIQSTLATIAFEVSTETKGLPAGLIGLCLFSGGGLGTAFSGWLLSQVSYKILWSVLALGIVFFIFITAKLHFNKM